MIAQNIFCRQKRMFNMYLLGILFLVILMNMVMIKVMSQNLSKEIIETEYERKAYIYEKILFNSNYNLKYLYNIESRQSGTYNKWKLLTIHHPIVYYLYSLNEQNIQSNNVMPVFNDSPIEAAQVKQVMMVESNDRNMMYERYNEDFEFDRESVLTQSFSNQVYSMEQLNNLDFLINNLYTIDSRVQISKEDFDIKYFLTTSMKVNQKVEEPTILIYHTHSQESFVNTENNEIKTVVDIGDELTRILEEVYGYKVYHLRKEYDIINGVLDRSKAYELIQPDLKKILEEYPTIQVMLDIHRDGVPEDVHLATEIDGKPTAKVMFFNGLSKVIKNGELVKASYLDNPYVKDNMALSLQMQLKAKEIYPSFTRKIYIRDYRYNLHFLPKSMLIEVGAQNNTYEEAENAMAPLAEILNEVIN